MKNKPGTTSTSLLIRLRQRDDEAAWDRFDAFYLPLVEYWCANLQASDRQDVAQLVAIKVHQSIDDFQRQRHRSFRRWLKKITESQIAEWFRQRGKEVLHEYIEGFHEHQDHYCPVSPAVGCDRRTARIDHHTHGVCPLRGAILPGFRFVNR